MFHLACTGKTQKIFFDACNYDYSNPYINMRIGECYVFIDDEEKAKEYLLRAYMMAGEDVFEGN